jgi:hypothetical protein
VLDEVAPELVEELLETVELVLVAAAEFAVWRARAGSWPVTSTAVINSQVAMNSATRPAITRRRITRTRALRASRIAVASPWVMDVIVLQGRSSRVRDH